MHIENGRHEPMHAKQNRIQSNRIEQKRNKTQSIRIQSNTTEHRAEQIQAPKKIAP